MGPGSGTTTDPGDGIVNLATADQALGTADLTIDAPLAIDTTAMTLDATLPAGVTFEIVPQNGDGPELAVLRVRTLNIAAPVEVDGSRPLVVVSDSLALSGRVTVTAHLDLSSAGDTNPLTANRGGAIEIYARRQIAISGEIHAGSQDARAHDGGGSAKDDGATGAIVLQAPEITNSGRLFANPGMATLAGGSAAGNAAGKILMIYRTTLTVGMTTPAPVKSQY